MLPSRCWSVDLPRMIDNQEPEGHQLEYKEARALLKNNESRRDDVSKDVSSFLNAGGGSIVYGIRQDRGGGRTTAPIPLRFDPQQDGFDPTTVTVETLENVITSSIYKRPGGDLFHIEEVPMAKGRVVFVVDVAQSMVGAFQAHDRKFYRRSQFKAEPMFIDEIDDVRNRAVGPQLQCIVGVDDMWNKALRVPPPEPEGRVRFDLHFGLLNVGVGIAEVALLEFGFDSTDVGVGTWAPVAAREAGVREIYWTVPPGVSRTHPEGAEAQDTSPWYQARWTPQVLGSHYQPLWATEDPVYYTRVTLKTKPGREGRLTWVPWRLQAPNMPTKIGSFAVDYTRGKVIVRDLVWQVRILPVLGSG